LTFDEILKKGFDGHNFVVGLCEHFRNLMVCRDAATIQLLQVSGNVQRKYMEQSTQASLSFLLSALQLGSQCDLNYKSSKNQRLHVELALMKMAHIPSAVNLTKSLQEGTLELKKKAEPSNDNGQHISVKPVEPVNQPAVKENGNSGYTPTASTKATVKIPATLADIEKQIQLSAEAVQEKKSVDDAVTEDQPFTKEQLVACWQTFANSRQNNGLSTEQIILRKPIELSGQTIILKLDNHIQIAQLSGFKPELMAFLRRNLKNSAIQLQEEVGPQEARKTIYTSQEKFKYLAEKHPLLLDLKATLGLDLDV
jgi:DNA polymerase-3 subunit gamma/tau